MKMSFGKHQGTEVHELPTSYLSWLIDNVNFRNLELEQEVIDEYDDRGESDD